MSAPVFSPLTDIKPKSNDSASLTGNADKPLWSHSDNSFKFDFLPNNVPALAEESSLTSESSEAAKGSITFKGQGSFAFNFQIPSAAPVEHMDTSGTPQSPSLIQEEQPSLAKDVTLSEAGVQTKSKKKNKKSGKKTQSDKTVSPQEPAKAEGNQGGEDVELVSVSEFLLKVSWRKNKTWANLSSHWFPECRNATEQTAGLVHRAAWTRDEVAEGNT